MKHILPDTLSKLCCSVLVQCMLPCATDIYLLQTLICITQWELEAGQCVWNTVFFETFSLNNLLRYSLSLIQAVLLIS